MDQDHDVITADLMEQPEAAAELKVHPSTLRRWEALDQGPRRIKIGKKVFYRASSLRTWLLAHETGNAGHTAVKPPVPIAPPLRRRIARASAGHGS